jgi:VWFA-related protein
MKISMRANLRLFVAFCGSLLLMQLGVGLPALACSALAGQEGAQALLQPGGMLGTDAGLLGADAKEDSQYSEGTRAIRESRWADAESIFGKLAAQHGDHSEGALYWKAYAQNKQGHADVALKSCAELRQGYPRSRWIDECSALELEIHGGKGQPVAPGNGQDETARLHAIDAMMDKDPTRALSEIQAILSGDQPEEFKERALFLLVESDSKQARQMLVDAGNSTNPALQARARQIMATVLGQQARQRHQIGVDLRVIDSNGKPVAGLAMRDFTVLDNNEPRKIMYFESTEPVLSRDDNHSVPVLIVIDTINEPLTEVAYVRQEMANFLRKNNGKLDRPVSILLLNGNGVQTLAGPSRDGNALAKAVDQADTMLHIFRRAQGFYGDVDRVQFSLNALNYIAGQELKQPGRKMLLWISRGWPLLPWANSTPTERQLKWNFAQIVAMSTNLRLARISLYSMDPNRTAGEDSILWNRYKDYLKPVVSAKRVELSNLALQVLAVQSGGRAFNYSSKFLSEEIAETLVDADAPYYTIHFDAPATTQKDEFHSLKITTNQPGTTVISNYGYYNEP